MVFFSPPSARQLLSPFSADWLASVKVWRWRTCPGSGASGAESQGVACLGDLEMFFVSLESCEKDMQKSPKIFCNFEANNPYFNSRNIIIDLQYPFPLGSPTGNGNNEHNKGYFPQGYSIFMEFLPYRSHISRAGSLFANFSSDNRCGKLAGPSIMRA